jgi:hypothetical protein
MFIQNSANLLLMAFCLCVFLSGDTNTSILVCEYNLNKKLTLYRLKMAQKGRNM